MNDVGQRSPVAMPYRSKVIGVAGLPPHQLHPRNRAFSCDVTRTKPDAILVYSLELIVKLAYPPYEAAIEHGAHKCQVGWKRRQMVP